MLACLSDGSGVPRTPAARVLAALAAGFSAAVILFLTLRPAPASSALVARIGHVCLICGSQGLADAIVNVLLFLPLGAALGAARMRPRCLLVTVASFSAAIELAQLGIPGRFANVGDVVFNTTGGVAGGLLVLHARALRAGMVRHGRSIGPSLALLSIGVAVASAWLLLPKPQRGTYYGQWTADLGPSLGVYGGRVISAFIGDRPAPSRRLADSEAARHSLLSGDTIVVVAIAGPPPERLAPIFSIYDQQRTEVMLLGAEGSDLVLRMRRNAARWRLDQPDLRWQEALRGVGPGDTVRVSLWRNGAWGFCLRAAAPVRCATVGPWEGWMLLHHSGDLPTAVTVLADALWLGMGAGLLLLGIGLGWRIPSERR